SDANAPHADNQHGEGQNDRPEHASLLSPFLIVFDLRPGAGGCASASRQAPTRQKSINIDNVTALRRLHSPGGSSHNNSAAMARVTRFPRANASRSSAATI